jgi:hypothetical protein
MLPARDESPTTEQTPILEEEQDQSKAVKALKSLLQQKG